jgi:segregation and condensation protein B
MDQAEKRRIVEALILGSAEPISATRLAELIPYCKTANAHELVEELNAEYVKHGRAFEICAVAGGYQLRSLPEFAPYLQQILKTRPLRLSQAALETLAIVAYQQPVTRAEVEQIRGVDAGPVLRGLIERKLVRIEQARGPTDAPRSPRARAAGRAARRSGSGTRGRQRLGGGAGGRGRSRRRRCLRFPTRGIAYGSRRSWPRRASRHGGAPRISCALVAWRSMASRRSWASRRIRSTTSSRWMACRWNASPSPTGS